MIKDAVKKILLVEDNPDDEAMTLRALEKLGIKVKVVVARDGEEACRMLFGPEAMRPELVFLDLNLPKMGGLEVLRRIRKDEGAKHLHVVIFTTSLEEEDAVRGYGLGVDSFVRKPVDSRDFALVIRTLGLYWLTEGGKQ